MCTITTGALFILFPIAIYVAWILQESPSDMWYLYCFLPPLLGILIYKFFGQFRNKLSQLGIRRHIRLSHNARNSKVALALSSANVLLWTYLQIWFVSHIFQRSTGYSLFSFSTGACETRIIVFTVIVFAAKSQWLQAFERLIEAILTRPTSNMVRNTLFCVSRSFVGIGLCLFLVHTSLFVYQEVYIDHPVNKISERAGRMNEPLIRSAPTIHQSEPADSSWPASTDWSALSKFATNQFKSYVSQNPEFSISLSQRWRSWEKASLHSSLISAMSAASLLSDTSRLATTSISREVVNPATLLSPTIPSDWLTPRKTSSQVELSSSDRSWTMVGMKDSTTTFMLFNPTTKFPEADTSSYAMRETHAVNMASQVASFACTSPTDLLQSTKMSPSVTPVAELSMEFDLQESPILDWRSFVNSLGSVGREFRASEEAKYKASAISSDAAADSHDPKISPRALAAAASSSLVNSPKLRSATLSDNRHLYKVASARLKTFNKSSSLWHGDRPRNSTTE